MNEILDLKRNDIILDWWIVIWWCKISHICSDCECDWLVLRTIASNQILNWNKIHFIGIIWYLKFYWIKTKNLISWYHTHTRKFNTKYIYCVSCDAYVDVNVTRYIFRNTPVLLIVESWSLRNVLPEHHLRQPRHEHVFVLLRVL